MKGRWESYINVWFTFMYSQKWNCSFQNRIITFCFPVPKIPTLIYLWEMYIFPGSVCLFCCREICGPILGIYKSLTDTWMWKLGLRLRNSQKRNTKMGFSLQIVQSKQHIQGTDTQTIHKEQMSGPHTGNRYADHTREQICRPCTEWELIYRPHTGNRCLDHTQEMYIYRPHTGNRCIYHTPGTDMQTTEWELIYRPHTGNRYTDHPLGTDIRPHTGTDIQITHWKQIKKTIL